MNITPEAYGKMTQRVSPKSPSAVNVPTAFAVGGGICVLGELLRELLMSMGLAEKAAGTWTSVLLIGMSVLLTGLGWYGKLAKHAGAGTLVPITGFANAVGSSAVEAKSEGYILGVGAKIFTIAGPVILYGSAASAAYGLIYYLARLI
ncbi:MAG: SpoVA/SpoVAEb family sporulation membrane protein [Ruminococcus sp.]|nr:SpoVA/SpoVAEb family sporulation membrane protein [Ruminococcus sp.]